ncbi:MAG TPA: hypothetical protein VJ975_09100 [Candidatus Limnocylindria bacterium]|nr:hypothetical protein [Candidatus Limnocylindria bacterium]
MCRSARLRPAALAATCLALAPGIASAHAIGGTFQLPVPLWLYLAGAAIAVAASFVVTSLVTRGGSRGYSARPLPDSLASVARAVLRIVGLAWWYGAIVVAFVVGDISPLPGVLFWIGIWVGLPIAAALMGNPWPSLSPFRATFAGMEWLARRIGATQLDLGIPYPAALARWPAVALLAAGVWAELILPASDAALTVGLLLTGYTLLTLAGMIVFGQIAWLRNAELFEVELGWFGRIGPIGRRSTSAALCDGCGEACDIERCIDCPECSTAAEDAERRPILRPWIVGLTDVTRGGWSDAAFIILVLAGVTYDGLRETGFGAALLSWLLPPITGAFGITLTAFLLVDTVAFALVVAAFLAAFGSVLWLTGRIGASTVAPPGVYAATLLPIAAGYLIAHYLTLVIQGAVWLPSLLVDPLMSLAPELDWIPVALVWYLSVGAIVGGHVAGIVLAHRLAMRDTPRRATVSGLPMVGLMIAYTVLSLWIIAQPIVIEPGLTPVTGLR